MTTPRNYMPPSGIGQAIHLVGSIVSRIWRLL